MNSNLTGDEILKIQDMINDKMHSRQIVVDEKINSLYTDIKSGFDKIEKESEKMSQILKANSQEAYTFRNKIYSELESVRIDIVSVTFKHNWKTAFWVFIGATTPVAIGLITLFLTKN